MALLRFLVALSCLASSLFAAPAEEEIHAGFAKYRQAMLAADGEAAWSVMDARTIEFYDGVASDALTLRKAEVDRLDFIRKFTLLRLRHEFPRAELQTMSGKSIFVLGVNRGWISRSTVEKTTALHAIRIEADEATAELPQAPGVPAFHFTREKDGWKFALSKSFGLANAAMEQMRRKQELSEGEFVTRLLGAVSKREVDPAIFDRPRD